MAIDDGGPAFPNRDVGSKAGMSLRDWFAGQALIGLFAMQANPLFVKNSLFSTGKHDDEMAKACFKLADAMLKARKWSGQ